MVYLAMEVVKSRLCRLSDIQLSGEPVLDTPHLPVCPTINALVALEAILNPNSDVQPFVDQVLMLARLMVSSLWHGNNDSNQGEDDDDSDDDPDGNNDCTDNDSKKTKSSAILIRHT